MQKGQETQIASTSVPSSFFLSASDYRSIYPQLFAPPEASQVNWEDMLGMVLSTMIACLIAAFALCLWAKSKHCCRKGNHQVEEEYVMKRV